MRLAYGDTIRVCGLIAVLLIHVCGFGRRPPLAEDTTGWWICNAFSSLSQWAVPVFVMLSGALLLNPDRQETPLAFARKRFLRVGVPLLFWCYFYLSWSNPKGMSPQSWDFLRQGRPYYHLYFLFIVAGLYLLTPPLRALIRFLGDRARWWLGTTALAIAGATVFWRPEAEGRVAWMLFVPYLGYYILGFSLKRRTGDPLTPLLGLLGWLLAAAYLVFGEWVRAADAEPTEALRYVIQGHFSPAVILESLGVFVCLREWVRRESRWVRELAQLSLGIYLIHPYLLEELAKSGLGNRWHGPAVGVPVTIVVLLGFSTLAVYLIQRAPFAKLLIGG